MHNSSLHLTCPTQKYETVSIAKALFNLLTNSSSVVLLRYLLSTTPFQVRISSVQYKVCFITHVVHSRLCPRLISYKVWFTNDIIIHDINTQYSCDSIGNGNNQLLLRRRIPGSTSKSISLVSLDTVCSNSVKAANYDNIISC